VWPESTSKTWRPAAACASSNARTVSPDEVLMSIYVEGVRRMEVVSMKRVGNEWKFGGFRRNAPK
jgi:hypothetical protein